MTTPRRGLAPERGKASAWASGAGGTRMTDEGMGGDISAEKLAEVIGLMRAVGVDLQRYEVKSSKKELTKDIARTISAFSNGSGGFIICGISEKDGFVPVGGFDVQSVQDSLAHACAELMSPPVRPDIQAPLFEGKPVVVAHISEMRPADKPCFIKASDRYSGSYIRTGDGDMRLTSYEVDRLIDEHNQPQYDARVVEGAQVTDLSQELVGGLLARERRVHARNFAKLDDTAALLRLGAILPDESGIPRPTLAGLMALGDYPQQFFPRLNVSFACYPGTRKSDVTSFGERLLDSATMVGPIPQMVEDAIAAVGRNTRTGAIVKGAYRREVPDYPPIALREAIVNALMHRDYSPQSLGTPVQVDLYVDRLEIVSPGGLFGNVTVRTLGVDGITSTRNQHLANLLESTPYADGTFVAENRGTGYQTIEAELAGALMPKPVAKDTIAFFSLTFQRRRLTDSEASLPVGEQVKTAILGALETKGSVSTTELMQVTGRSRATVYKYVKQMIADGTLEPMEARGSTKQRYRMRTR